MAGPEEPLVLRIQIGTSGGLDHFTTLDASGTQIQVARQPADILQELALRRKELQAHWSAEANAVLGFSEQLSNALPYELLSQLQSAVAAAVVQRTSLRIELEFINDAYRSLPWEWLALRRRSPLDLTEGPLALVPNTRIVRVTKGERVSIPEDSLRILIATADPASPRFPTLPWLGQEAASVAAAFAASRRRGIQLETLADCLPAALEEKIAEFRPHLFHFAGHGETRPSGCVLALRGPRAHSERLVRAETLGQWLIAAETQFVFLSACDTAGNEVSAAETLVKAGIPNVVAMQIPVADASQPHFARVFYGSFLGGATVDESVAEARQASASGLGWAPPVLYGSEPSLKIAGATKSQIGLRVPNNLPLPSTQTVGRDEAIDSLAQTLLRSPLVALIGPGGIGKTRLAVEAAIASNEAFPKGIWFVECESCTSRQHVVVAIAAALGVEHPENSGMPDLQNRLCDGGCLLVLDCFENVVAEGHQSIIAEIREATGASILATSRFRLDLPEETVFEVPPLNAATADAVSLMRQSPSLEGRRLTESEIRDLSLIAGILEGIPLALMIAAGRLRFIPTSQLLKLLRDRPLSALGGRNSGVSLAIRRSLDLVSPEDMSLLRELSVFAGTLSYADLCEVYPDDDGELLEGLSRLADRSLIQTDGRNESRFRILDSLREYLVSLDESEVERERLREARERHLAVYLKAIRSIGELHGQGRWTESMSLLWQALPNLRVALEFAAENDYPDEAVEFCRLMAINLMEAGWGDFDRIVAIGHRVAEKYDRPTVKGSLLSLEGVVRSREGDDEAAEKLWQQRLQICRDVSDSFGITDSLLDLASVTMARGALELSSHWLEEANMAIRELDRPDLLAVLLTLQARFYDAQDKPELSRQFSDEAEIWLQDASYSNQSLFVFTTILPLWQKRRDSQTIRHMVVRYLREAIAGERRNHAGILLIELGQALETEHYFDTGLKCFWGACDVFGELGSHRIKKAERLFEAFKTNHPEVSADQICGRSWRTLLPEIFAFVDALAVEEDLPND